jgi:glycine dehydrogenase subunit 1
VREFAIRVDAPIEKVLDHCAEEGIAAGYWLGREYPEYEDGLLVAITERRSKGDIDRLVETLARATAKTARDGALVAHSATKAPSAEVGA